MRRGVSQMRTKADKGEGGLKVTKFLQTSFMDDPLHYKNAVLCECKRWSCHEHKLIFHRVKQFLILVHCITGLFGSSFFQ